MLFCDSPKLSKEYSIGVICLLHFVSRGVSALQVAGKLWCGICMIIGVWIEMYSRRCRRFAANPDGASALFLHRGTWRAVFSHKIF